jgi:formylmethanofuran dehydrogenase subunit C
MPVQLVAKSIGPLPLHVAKIVPSQMRGRTSAEISSLPVTRGKRTFELGQFFDISGSLQDESDTVEWIGDIPSVHWLGASMDGGQMTVRGNVGRHVASGMCGGTLTVHGNVGDYVGSRLSGGLVRVHGDAADWAGGAYEHESVGMRGGELIISGSSGRFAGARLRRGLIYIGGDCGPGAGMSMRAGTIVIDGSVTESVGLDMRRGTIVLTQSPERSLRHSAASEVDLVAMRLLQRRLAELGIDTLTSEQAVLTFSGDTVNESRGEILVQEKDAQ